MKHNNAPQNDCLPCRYDRGFKSICFHLKQTAQREKSTQIMVAVNVMGRRIRIYTRCKVEPQYWDSARDECVESPLLSRRVRERLLGTNETLRCIRREIQRADMESAEQGSYISGNEIRCAVLRAVMPAAFPVVASVRCNQPLSPVQQLRQIARNFDGEINSKGVRGSSASASTYLGACGRLEQFMIEKHFRISSFREFDSVFYREFTLWLNTRTYTRRGVPTLYSASTVSGTLVCVRNLLRKAYDKKVSDCPAIDVPSMPADTDCVSEKIYLNEHELERLAALRPDGRRRQQVLDMFLIAAYTALRLSDINRLNQAVLSNDFISLVQHKTREQVRIPILREIRDLVTRYTVGGPAFPHIDKSFANRTLKELARQAGICQMVTMSSSRGGSDRLQIIPKCELVTFHTARRSCITNLYRRGYSANYIMSLSGHKSMSSFQRYMKASAADLSADFERELRRHNDI